MSMLAGFIHRQFLYEPPVPTESFQGKTAIVTGANAGLGKAACQWLVKLGASQVILACRNVEKGKLAAKELQVATSCSIDMLQVWHLDMSSYASVLAFGDRVTTELPRVDAVLLNAGLMTRHWNMAEGSEEVLNTNCISTVLLAFLLHPKLRETASKYQVETHISATASELYQYAKFTERRAADGQLFATLSNQKTANMSDRYNVTKLILVLAIKQMAVLSPSSSSGVIVNCTAPGMCDSDLGRDFGNGIAIRAAKRVLCRTSEVGSRTMIHGASVGPESHGQYLPDCKITPTKGLTKGKEGAELQKRVWLELRKKLEDIRPGVTSLA